MSSIRRDCLTPGCPRTAVPKEVYCLVCKLDGCAPAVDHRRMRRLTPDLPAHTPTAMDTIRAEVEAIRAAVRARIEADP